MHDKRLEAAIMARHVKKMHASKNGFLGTGTGWWSLRRLVA